MTTANAATAATVHDDEQEPPREPSPFEVLPVETLAAVLEQSVDCIKIGVDGNIRYMTAGCLSVLGYDSIHEVEGLAWPDIWPEPSQIAAETARLNAATGQIARFHVQRPNAKGQPHWFDVSIMPVMGEGRSVRGLIAVIADVTASELAKQALDVKTAEMRHRLKNTYAMIASLISSFSRGTPEREAFAEQMIDRLSALGTAQTLLANQSNTACRVQDLVPAVVGAYETKLCPVTVQDLSEADLDQGQADAIALILGELAVNSDKHGALGSKGHIEINVERHDDTLEVLWSETGNRLVEARTREGGQGLRLMDRVARSRHGSFSIDWKANGLDAKLTMKLA